MAASRQATRPMLDGIADHDKPRRAREARERRRARTEREEIARLKAQVDSMEAAAAGGGAGGSTGASSASVRDAGDGSSSDGECDDMPSIYDVWRERSVILSFVGRWWGRPDAQLFLLLMFQLALPQLVPRSLRALGIPPNTGTPGGLQPNELVLAILQWEIGFRICRQLFSFPSMKQLFAPDNSGSGHPDASSAGNAERAATLELMREQGPSYAVSIVHAALVGVRGLCHTAVLLHAPVQAQLSIGAPHCWIVYDL